MLKGLFESLGRQAAKRPGVLVLIVVVLTAGAINGAGMIGFASGNDTFISKDSPLYQAYDSYSQNFLTENIVLMVETQEAAAPDELRALNRFDSAANDIEGVADVTSAADLVAPGGEVPSTRAQIKRRLLAAPSSTVERVLPDRHRALVLVTMERGLTEKQTQAIYPKVQRAAEWADFPAGTTTTVTGSPVFGLQMQRAMQKDLGSMFGAAALLMVVALFLFFANVEYRLLPLAIVLIGVFWTLGGMGYLSVPMTMVSMAVFPILVGLGIDYAVQIHSRAQEELKKGKPGEAIPKAYRTTGPAVLTALVATGLGFVAMMTSPIPMIKDFGMMALIGIVASFAAVLLLLVPLYLFLDTYVTPILRKIKDRIPSTSNPVSLPIPDLDRVVARIAVKAAKNPVPILLVSLLLMVGGFAASGQVDIQIEEEAMIPQDMPALLAIQKYQEMGQGGRPISLVVTGDVTSPDTLQWMNSFQQSQVEKNPHFVSSTSLATIVAEANGGTVPDDPSKVERIVQSLPDSTVDRHLEGNSKAVINFDLPGFIGFEKTMDTIGTVQRDAKFDSPPPGVDVAITGGTVLMTNAFNAIANGRTRMSLLAFLLIFLGLLVIYRHPVRAFVPVIPLSFVTGWNGAAMFLTGTDYTPLTATLGALSIGVGSEYTILVMERYFEERKHQDPIDAIETAASRIGRAITVSGFTTVFGFSALMASNFPMIQNFGRVTVITVLLALTASFLVLPPLLVGLDRYLMEGPGAAYRGIKERVDETLRREGETELSGGTEA